MSRGQGRVTLGLAIIGWAAFTTQAQEAVLMAQANQDSAATRSLNHATTGYYNLELGKLTLRFASSAGAQFNDNINLQSTGRLSDVILTPGLSADLRYPVSDQNTLNLSLGLGYSYYLSHAEYDYFNITPGSELSFDLFVGDTKINLHDRVSITQSTYQNPTANGNNTSQLQNTAGLSATRDMNKLLVQLGYDHNNSVTLGSSPSAQPNGSSDLFFGNFGIHCPYDILAGIEAGGGFINYDPVNNATYAPNATEANLGVFAQSQISEYINARVNVGYSVYMPEATGSLTNQTQNSGLYFGLTVTHRLNRFVTYSLAGGKSQNLSAYGQSYESYYVQLNPDWKIFEKVSVSTPVFWQHGSYNSSSFNFYTGTFDQFGAGLTLGRPITQKLSASFSYQFVNETATGNGLAYTVNIVSLNFTYQF